MGRVGVTSGYSIIGTVSPIVVLGLDTNSYASSDFIDFNVCPEGLS